MCLNRVWAVTVAGLVVSLSSGLLAVGVAIVRLHRGHLRVTLQELLLRSTRGGGCSAACRVVVGRLRLSR